MKIVAKWKLGSDDTAPRLKWYRGPEWKWKLWWRWFGYNYVWEGYLKNSGKFKGRFVETPEELLTCHLAEQIQEEIDKQILADLEKKR